MTFCCTCKSFSGGSDDKEYACNTGDLSLIPGSGRSPGEGNSYPLQYSCLENFMDRGAWQAVTHGAAKSWTWLSCIHKWCGTAYTVPHQETLFISYFTWMLSCPSTETCHEWCPPEWHHIDCGWRAWEDSEYTCFTTQNRIPSVMLAMYMQR